MFSFLLPWGYFVISVFWVWRGRGRGLIQELLRDVSEFVYLSEDMDCKIYCLGFKITFWPGT